MVHIIEIPFPEEFALDLSRFREMDEFAVENYHLPIELMMENAGLQLANLIAHAIPDQSSSILIGIGNGNNGGGGLVAARRLAAWGYQVNLDLFTEINRDLPSRQLKRALKFGAELGFIEQPDIWVDAYLGFSQRLPLPDKLLTLIELANRMDCHKISLDIPTGFLGNLESNYFHADQILSLAASKKILFRLPNSIELYIADLGIPKEVYQKFGTQIPPFYNQNLIKIIRTNG